MPGASAAAAGIWPAEGAVSAVCATCSAQWACAGSQAAKVFWPTRCARATCLPTERNPTCTDPTALDGSNRICFFRDDRLSDLIGFEYKDWHGKDAAAISSLSSSRSRRRAGGRRAGGQRDSRRRERLGVLPLQRLLLSATNCTGRWRRIRHPHRNLAATSSTRSANPRAVLPQLVTGSWVYGNLSTWIGATTRTARGICWPAKHSYDLVTASGRLDAGRRRRPRASSPFARAPTGAGGSATTTRRTRLRHSIDCSAATSAISMSCSSSRPRASSTSRSAAVRRCSH